LLRRLKEADLVSGLRSTNITLVDPARVPARPSKPNGILYVAASIACGLFLGICAAVFRDTTDNRIYELPLLEASFNDIPLAMLPNHKTRRKLRSARTSPAEITDKHLLALLADRASANCLAATVDPRSPYTEALRSLRTSLLRGIEESPAPQVILVTSSIPAEGKSMLSTNLAILMAQQKKKTLLVDADLRTPNIHRLLNLKYKAGLSSMLANEKNIAGALLTPLKSVPSLQVLPAGPIPHYPAELLASEQLAKLILIWRREFDVIILDGAPALPVTDSVLLSAHADLTLVVSRYRVTERQSLERTCSLLREQGTKKMAVVLNGVPPVSSTYYNYYGHTNAGVYGSEPCEVS
jgi:succinoglycan biosynthesis transport protein ExoP